MRGVFPLTSCSKTVRNNGFGSICLTWHCLWCVYCPQVNYSDAEGIFCKAQCSPTVTDNKHDVGHVVSYQAVLPCAGVKQRSPWFTSQVRVQDMPSWPHPHPHLALTSCWHQSGSYQGPALIDVYNLALNGNSPHLTGCRFGNLNTSRPKLSRSQNQWLVI